MKKKTKKAKRITKLVQLKVRTGLKSGQFCLSDADCTSSTPYCVMGRCVECRSDADCSSSTPHCYSGWCED